MTPAGDLDDEGDQAWGYGLLQNDLAQGWEARFGVVLSPTRLEADRNAQALPSPADRNNPDTSAAILPAMPWSIEQLAEDQELRRTQVPRIEARTEALSTVAGDHCVALKVLGVLFLAAGVTMPGVVQARVLDAFDREIAHDRAEKESSGWDHWFKRVGILRAIRALIENGDANPIYVGDETMWALCDNSDLDGFLLTCMEPDSTGKSDDQTPATTPSVGIFWGVRDRAGPLVLVIDRTSLAEAEPYGDFLTHPDGHYEVWEAWRRLGTAGLSKQGLPSLMAWHEYEHFPRGRIVFDTTTNCFTLYADRKLQAPKTLARVLCAFGLDPARCAVRSDPHYRS